MIIFISFLIGWIVHILLSSKTEQRQSPVFVPQKDCLDSSEIFEKIVVKEVVQYVPKIKIIYKDKKKQEADANSSTEDLFLLALKENEFYDAMGYYEEAEEEKHPSYQSALFAYFSKTEKSNPNKAIEEMHSFIEIEPQSKIIVFQLAELFKRREEYQEALNLIIDFSYIVSYREKNAIHTKIKNISTIYIDKLKSANNFEDLVAFLMNQLNVGILRDFYSFELAKLYLKLKKYYASAEILETIKDNDIYKERALEMLAMIQLKLEEQEEYPVQIPLIKKGLHFLVRAYANDIPVLLLLDTGASITSISQNKISDFNILRKDVLFLTAGGNVYNTIFQANTFRIGSTSFTDFRIAGMQSLGGEEDGLLGMNFLGKFKFKIDQKEAILFLGDKN